MEPIYPQVDEHGWSGKGPVLAEWTPRTMERMQNNKVGILTVAGNDPKAITNYEKWANPGGKATKCWGGITASKKKQQELCIEIKSKDGSIGVEFIPQGTFWVIYILTQKGWIFYIVVWFGFDFLIFKNLKTYAFLKGSFNICRLYQNTSRDNEKLDKHRRLLTRLGVQGKRKIAQNPLKCIEILNPRNTGGVKK